MTITARDTIDALSMRLAGERFAKGVYGYTTPQFGAEPASFTLLALRGTLERQLLNAHLRVLTNFQRRNGFWPAADRDSGPGVWATAVAVNTLVELSPGDRALPLGIHALLDANPQEAHWLYRFRFRTTDTHVRFDANKYGWGWVPGTISWAIPTAMALIALERSRNLDFVPTKELDRRLDLAYAMLFDRMCRGGGWNAGNSVVYNVALAPHIDASAIALAALRKHYWNPEVEQSLSWLVSARCCSAYSLAWRILGLRSYLDIRRDFRAAIEVAREQLIRLLQDPAQSADTATLALSILALRNDMNPFALEPAW